MFDTSNSKQNVAYLLKESDLIQEDIEEFMNNVGIMIMTGKILELKSDERLWKQFQLFWHLGCGGRVVEMFRITKRSGCIYMRKKIACLIGMRHTI